MTLPLRAFVTGIALFVAGGASAAEPPLPAELVPAYQAGAASVDGYGWMRGMFPGASEQERALTDVARQFQSQCAAAATEAEMAKLQAIAPDATLPRGRYAQSGQCRYFASTAFPVDASWSDFSAALGRVLVALQRNELLGAAPRLTKPSMAEELQERAQRDQRLRSALIVAINGAGDFTAFTPLERQVARAMLSRIVWDSDEANADFIETHVLSSGWPDRRNGGGEAARAAWLLVQHADSRPSLQLRALRMMEPMLTSGAASGRDYAMLYDRVMLKLSGRQRYGTQWTCSGTTRTMLPHEGSVRDVEARRGPMGLEPLERNREIMDTAYGPCRAAQRP